ncbi:sulfate transporter family protein [Rhodoblastus sp.]|uniref:sulfate transporter family protein n=1 Tax=Rhodoblastus sp. TaxID=1962975 RepID=UPI003F96B3F9
MIDDAIASLREIFSKPFRAVLFKSLALTLALLAGLGLMLERVAIWVSAGGPPWLQALIEITAALGLFIGLIFLIPAVSMLVAGYFLDELAEHVEADIYPPGLRGSPAPVMTSLWLAAKFAVVALAVNFCAFCLWLLPGVNAVVFFVANAYLFSREYFQLAALRFRPLDEVVELRRRHRLTLFAAGLIIALFVVTPVLNLLTPLFGIALMARLHKRLAPPLIPAPQEAVVRQAF